jgi:glutamate racemase
VDFQVNEGSIGVFDSGLGGLTVVRALMENFPNESITYFGDTARVPYGGRSADVIKRYAIEDVEILLKKQVKMIVVACNSVSSTAMDEVERHLSIPVIGMIHPGVTAAVNATKNRRVGVIGTRATISSMAYQKALKERDKDIDVYSQACPLFVPLVEEGWDRHRVARIIVDEYLETLKDEKVDTLILGCTHYPVLYDTIQESMGKDVKLVDSGEAAAYEVEQILDVENIACVPGHEPVYEYYVSDFPQKFKELAELLLGKTLDSVTRIPW